MPVLNAIVRMSSPSDTSDDDTADETQKNELLDRIVNFLATYLP